MSEYEHGPDHTTPVGRPEWRRSAGTIGVALGFAAAVIAAALWFTPQVRAYSGAEPWVLIGVLGFVLVLGGAVLLVAASVSPTLAESAPGPAGGMPAPPVPRAFPDGSFPEDSVPSGGSPGAPAVSSAAGSPPIPPSTSDGAVAPAGRLLTLLGALLGAVGLGVAALALALAVLLPVPMTSIMVQFTDLAGRVQLEYCPTLPASFEATASHGDLADASTILPVKVSAETCGSTDYADGVWIYLNRTAVTVSARP
jgi:hypothetical protein